MYEVEIESSQYPEIIDPRYEKPTIDISIHPLESNVIIVIYPGANGSKDGYENKYQRIADKLVEAGLGAVIRSPNKYMIGNGWTTCLEIVIQYALNNSKEICGRENPNVYLIGHSAGAGAIDLIAGAYPQVKKILITSPAPIRKGLVAIHQIGEYPGELYVRIPENDRVVPRDDAMEFFNQATGASKRDLKIIDGCDHEWSGENNLQLFINQPVELLK